MDGRSQEQYEATQKWLSSLIICKCKLLKKKYKEKNVARAWCANSAIIEKFFDLFFINKHLFVLLEGLSYFTMKIVCPFKYSNLK
jgi:hypothetical protein